MEKNMWRVASSEEHELAKKTVSQLFPDCFSVSNCVDFIMHIEQYIHDEKMNLGKATSDGDYISNSIVSEIAFLLSERLMLNERKGVVLTPNVLAEDMVKMSIVEWVSSNSKITRNTVFEYLYKLNPICDSEEKLIKNCMSNLVWYDPCVGGGVFPMAILEVYKAFGLYRPPKIYGKDLNPIYIAATKKRMMLSLGNSEMGDFDDFFLCQDALDSHTSQSNLCDFFSEKRYDIVIGNPPYVKNSNIEKKAKEKYRRNYPEIENKGADLYVFFICNGLNALNDLGVLSFVTPAQFQMSNYGKSIRSVIEKKCDVLTVADFNELPVFENIGVHASVYSLLKHKRGQSFLRYEYDSLPSKNPLEKLYKEGKELPQKNISKMGWFFSSEKACEILNYLEAEGVPLIDYSGNVFSGIKTGCKKAYFLKEKDILEFEETDLCKCRKMVIPRKIKKWKSTWKDDFLLVVKKDEMLNETSKLYKHLEQYKEKLCGRADVESCKTWYGLRSCSYYNEFELPKIIYPDIATECRFSMDKDSMFIPDGAFFIPSENYYLLGVLNSCIGRFYFRQKCARIGNPTKGGRIRFKKIYIENFPVVLEKENLKIANTIKQLAYKAANEGELSDKEEKELDECAIKMYKIPDTMKSGIMEA